FLRGRWADVEQELSALRERLRPQRAAAAAAPAAAAAEGPLGACAAWLRLSQHRGTRATLLLMLFRQLSGVHAVAFFTVDMFSAAESAVSGQVCAVMIGVVQVAATVLCSLAVDTVGRRPLLFCSALGMAVCHMGLAYYFKFLVAGEDARGVWWLPVLMVSGFIVMYSLGLGPLPWLLMAELVPVRDRRWAAGLAGAVNWGAMYLVF
ncbi:Facilitated trehalose transporter Tret1, partial [Gryllus bimaculatus]